MYHPVSSHSKPDIIADFQIDIGYKAISAPKSQISKVWTRKRESHAFRDSRTKREPVSSGNLKFKPNLWCQSALILVTSWQHRYPKRGTLRTWWVALLSNTSRPQRFEQ
jgi:hypothetical protein